MNDQQKNECISTSMLDRLNVISLVGIRFMVEATPVEFEKAIRPCMPTARSIHQSITVLHASFSHDFLFRPSLFPTLWTISHVPLLDRRWRVFLKKVLSARLLASCWNYRGTRYHWTDGLLVGFAATLVHCCCCWTSWMLQIVVGRSWDDWPLGG